MAKNKIHNLYLKLYAKHGDPEKFWPQWCAKKKTPKLRNIIAIGAILTQRTSWHNADLALRNLKKENLLSLKKIASLRKFTKLTELIRPAGFYQTKPKRLFTFASFIVNNYGNLDNFAKEDLIVAREKLSDHLIYNCLKEFFEKSLPKKVAIYQDFHALIIVEQKGRDGSIMKII